MTPEALYVIAGAGVFMTGLAGTLGRAHLFWKVLGVNFMGSGIFLLLLAGAPRIPGEGADPVPQAMVLTGIVVATAATALGLGMALRVAVRSGGPYLSEDMPGARKKRTESVGSRDDHGETPTPGNPS
ncbi:MAG: NADH-quinone oxidoreductase subunit K [Gemmatimonadota bacterium]